jgi:predicted hotdog family 3-hydroxylacyl-ACP dehydratase
MIAKELLRSMIPHTGTMCLLDAVEDWTADRIHCTARTHTAAEHPLRLQNRLSALHLVEYAAQAVAVHGALLARAKDGRGENAGEIHPRPGMLAVLRDIKLHADRIDTVNNALAITAERRLVRNDGMVYEFSVRAGQRPLCEGRAVIALR